jgi:myo-inositol 2-dehydrogenase / D-chiro-inositol 1-dehydrogenase
VPRETRIGVIGCGRIAGLRHLPALSRQPDARVVAVADVHAERLARLADEFGIERRYSAHEHLLADPEVDAVAVLVPAAMHADVAIAALEAGKHVFVEKPLALGLGDADRLVERAASSDRHVLVAYNLRWHRLVREARRLLAAGAIGELEVLASSFTSPYAYRHEAKPWRLARETGGGALVEMGSHHFDLWRHLLDDDPVEVSAAVRDGEQEDEAATVHARMRAGTLVTGVFSQRTLDHQEVEVFGTEGRLRLGIYRFDGLEVTRRPGRVGDARGRLDGLGRLVRSLPAAAGEARAGGLFVASYRDEWRHFLAVCRGEAEPECTAEDGRRSLALLLGAAEAASTGRVVALDEAEAGLRR